MEYLTVTQVARVTGLGVDTVRRLSDKGKLPSIRLTADGWRRIEKQTVIEYAAAEGLRLDWQALQK